MTLRTKAQRILGWSFASVVFIWLWFEGGFWHYVVPILVGVSLGVIFAERQLKRVK